MTAAERRARVYARCRMAGGREVVTTSVCPLEHIDTLIAGIRRAVSDSEIECSLVDVWIRGEDATWTRGGAA